MVIALTSVMVVAEIARGTLFGSMALLAERPGLVHVTVEILPYTSQPCLPVPQ